MKITKPMYDLIPGQTILFYSQQFTVFRQVNNIFTLLTVNKKLDFNKLEEAVYLSYQNCDFIKLRLTKVKGKVKQYFLDSDKPKITMLDFTESTKEEMEEKLYSLAKIPIKLFNRQLSRVFLIRTYDGKEGIYFGVSHVVLDSWGICVFMKYVMDVYKSLVDETEMPKPLTPYEEVLKKDLDYPNTQRYQDDMDFWKKECEREEPWYTHINGTSFLEEYRKKKKDPTLQCRPTISLDTRAAHEIITIPKEDIDVIKDFCIKYSCPMQILFILGLRTMLSARNDRQPDVSFYSPVARRATLKEKSTGGSRLIPVMFRTILSEDTKAIDALKIIHDRQKVLFRHANLDMLKVMQLMTEAYHPNDKLASYLACCLTFQPVQLSLTDGTHINSKWYGNGAASQPFYLTVMDDDASGGLRCYYEYQTKPLSKQKIRDCHSYMMSCIMAVVENEQITIGELLDLYDE